MRFRSTALACTFALTGLIGCPQKEEAPAAVTPSKTAPAKPTAGAASAPATAGAASKPASPHGEVDKRPSGAPFSGLIKLGEGIKPEDIKPTDVLFVMARQSLGPNAGGSLVAVMKLGNVEFPKRYELSQANVMVPGIPFAGPFLVMARLDRDGDPMTKNPDDLYAAYPEPVKNGQEGVHLVLKKGAALNMNPPKPGGAKGAASKPAGAASQPGK